MACSYLDKLWSLCDVQDILINAHKPFIELMLPTLHSILINSILFMKLG
jgi:hypothetical protein